MEWGADQYGVFCPDAHFFVRFSIAEHGKLKDCLGTANGSSLVQLANGRAGIFILPCKGKSIAGVSADGLETSFIEIKSKG